MIYIYKVYSESLRELLLTTDSFQSAIDCWSTYKVTGKLSTLVVMGDTTFNPLYFQTEEAIKDWADSLISKNYNRVERRIAMDVLEKQLDNWEKNTGDRPEYEGPIETIYESGYKTKLSTVPEETNSTEKPVDFHGDFKSMSSEQQDAVINPKHYKLIPKEAYEKYPVGMEYMHLMEYLLSHLSGHEAHTLGHIFKYSCRVGKKDDKLQDAKKIAWYANHLVKVLENDV